MSKAARGTKRVCTSCGARFYDLNRDPIECPLCQALFEPEPEPKPKPKPKPKPAPVVKTPAPEKEASPKESVDPKAPEFVSLEEAEAEENADVPDIEEEVAAIGGDDIPAGEDDNSFLETEDEGEPDVSGIIGAPIKPVVES